MKKLLPVLFAIIALTACGSNRDSVIKDVTKDKVKDEVRRNLKDPDSAKFGDYHLNSKTGRGCIEVNAKNDMGGYTGDDLWMFLITGDKVEAEPTPSDGFYTFAGCVSWSAKQ